jgi:hypothetical protein
MYFLPFSHGKLSLDCAASAGHIRNTQSLVRFALRESRSLN